MSVDTTWQPGDPLVPDNGCGTIPAVSWTTQEQQAAVAEDDLTPPWFRPEPEGPAHGYTRTCKPCGVGWRGDEPCWMCGGDQSP